MFRRTYSPNPRLQRSQFPRAFIGLTSDPDNASSNRWVKFGSEGSIIQAGGDGITGHVTGTSVVAGGADGTD